MSEEAFRLLSSPGITPTLPPYCDESKRATCFHTTPPLFCHNALILRCPKVQVNSKFIHTLNKTTARVMTKHLAQHFINLWRVRLTAINPHYFADLTYFRLTI